MTCRVWRTPRKTRHAMAASTKATNKTVKTVSVTDVWSNNAANDGATRDGPRQDPAGVDRHGDVGPRSRPRPYPRGRNDRDRRRPQHARRGAGDGHPPGRRGPRGDGLLEQGHA